MRLPQSSEENTGVRKGGRNRGVKKIAQCANEEQAIRNIISLYTYKEEVTEGVRSHETSMEHKDTQSESVKM